VVLRILKSQKTGLWRTFVNRLLLVACLSLAPGVVTADHGKSEIRLAMSEEIRQSGIGEALINEFTTSHPGITIKVVPVMESTALSLARDGLIDAAMVERSSVTDLLDAWAVIATRQELLRGYQVLVAPSNDPLGLLKTTSIDQAVDRLAASRSSVILPPARTPIATRFEALLSLSRSGNSVSVIGFSGSDVERLEIAARRGSHTIVHLGNWIEAGRDVRRRLRLVKNATLQSVYDYLAFSSSNIPDSSFQATHELAAFLQTPKVRDLIADYGSDEGLAQFTPAAVTREAIEFQPESRGSGKYRWLFVVGAIIALMGLTIFLTRMYLRERNRFRSVSRLMRAVEGARDGVWDWDVEKNRAFFTRRSFKVLGLPPEETGIASPMKMFLSAVHPGWRDNVRDQLQGYLDRHKTGRFSIDYRVRDRGDKPVWVRMRGLVVCDANNKVTRISGSVMDVSNEKRQEAQLRHQVLHDALTGLPNRSLMHNRLESLLEKSRERTEPFALMMIDLNRFKEINDSLGHGVGDELLRAVAGRLSNAMREKDTVARLGGDEFAILLPATNTQGAYTQAQKIRDSLSQRPVMLYEHSLVIEASIGVSMFPDHGDSVDALMQRADMAMYTSKRNKVDCTFYSAAANPNSLGRIELENELRKAIDQDGLELHYQPKIDLARRRVVGVEALIRWTHPEYGVIRPQRVAELAEKSGLIHTLSGWVIKTASRQTAAWSMQNITMPMAINLSVWNIQNPEIVDVVKKYLRESRVSPKLVEFEITESAMIVDPIRAHKTLKELSDLGISFSVDDFGTGFSSLAYLKRLPVQTVKIDQSFVREMVHDLADRSIVQSTIDMAHNLGLKVVAEGIEDKEMLSLLIEMQCDQGQGFLFSKALPPDEFLKWLSRSPLGVSAMSGSGVVPFPSKGVA